MADKIKHVVVLMFENRSLDNLFGYLYEDKPEKTFNGVVGKDLSNPIPEEYQDDEHPKEIKVSKGGVFHAPGVDPGEEYGHLNICLWNTVNPPENAKLNGEKMIAPWNIPDTKEGEELPEPNMKGFVRDYIYSFEDRMKRKPTYEDFCQIMNCLTPESVPVCSALARGFSLCDNYFCDVPTQTCPNRSFFFSATSSGSVINDPANMSKWTKKNTARTLFNQLEEEKISWRIYFDSNNIVPFSYLIHHQALKKIPERVGFMDHFFDDVRKGTLPQYSFIEPRLWLVPNDFHPTDEHNLDEEHSAVLGGENLLHEVYTAIKASHHRRGSNWENTLLIVTFDEAGGTYDHVVPPKATPPSQEVGEHGFRFDRLGIRVPCMLISPWIAPETVISDQLQHTSMLGFIRKIFKMKADPLNPRDASAPQFDMSKIFTLKKPRDRRICPVTTPHVLPSEKTTVVEDITRLHLTILNGLVSVVGENADAPHRDVVKLIHTVTAANKWMTNAVKDVSLFPSLQIKPKKWKRIVLSASIIFCLFLLALVISLIGRVVRPDYEFFFVNELVQ